MSLINSKSTNVVLGLSLVAVITYMAMNKPSYQEVSETNAVVLENEKDTFSYAIGVQVADQLKQGMADEVNPQAFSKAILDVLTDSELQLSQDEILAAIDAKREQEEAAYLERLEGNKAEAEKYFVENQAKPGVQVTESGIQYEVITASDKADAKMPLLESTVTVHYKGTLLNGEEFDSSYTRGEPIDLPVGGVILGWQEILPLMKEGDKWRVSVPAELAYGEQGAGGVIEPNAALIFEIELIAVK